MAVSFDPDRPAGSEPPSSSWPATEEPALREAVDALFVVRFDTARLLVPDSVLEESRGAFDAACGPDRPAEDGRPAPAVWFGAPGVLRAPPLPPVADLRAALAVDDADLAGIPLAGFVATDLPGALLAADLAAAWPGVPLPAADLAVAGLAADGRLADFAMALPAVRPLAVFTAGLPTVLPPVFFVDFVATALVGALLRAAVLPAALPVDLLVVAPLLAALLPAEFRPAAAPRVLAPDADFAVAVFFAAGLLAPVFLLADLRGLVVAMRVSRRLVAPRCSGNALDNTMRMQDR